MAREVDLDVDPDHLFQHRPELMVTLFSYASIIAMSYRGVSPMRTGLLANSAKPGLAFSTYKGYNRPIGTVTNRVPYAVWVQTGAGPRMHQKSTGRMPRYGPFKGSFTYRKIVEAME